MVKGFKEFLAEQSEPKPLVIWFETDDEAANAMALACIEEGQTLEIDNRYSARHDIAKQPNQKNHTHVMLNNRQVCIVNDDGTPSHNSKPFASLPKKIQNKLHDLGWVARPTPLNETASEVPLLPRNAIMNFWLKLLAREA